MNMVKKGDISILGKTVSVKIDRPVGTRHPKHEGLVYPINYGFVEGLFAGDGEEQDVYVLGIENKPISSFEGVVIAVIERLDDNEDKWVAVPRELVGTPICYECNIMHEISFQEQFYKSECRALYKKTCGCVMYTELDGERKYLLIENKDSGHIGFPKGHVEYGESELQTAVREVKEETGLCAEPIEGFRVDYSFLIRGIIHKNPVYFVSHYNYSGERLQEKEISRSWLLNYADAMALLNYEQDKNVLSGAESFLTDQA